jgi:FMN phosphatase YigB (HAD superfamily)
MGAIRAVLVDVGGTLWSEHSTASREELRAQRDRRLQAAGVTPERMVPLRAALAERVRDADGLDYFDVWAAVELACAAAGVSGVSAEAIRHANSLPATSFTRLLPGARSLLETIRGLGLRCVIVSNGIWRSEADYWDDFRAFKLAEPVNAIVSSVDTLWRKPHRRFYEAAVRAADTGADRCVIVGNSEAKDIAPALALGMSTVRVAIEDEHPSLTSAQFVCDSLEQVAGVLRTHLGAD